MNISVSIERLVLEGLALSHAQGPLIGAAIETELTRLLATGGLEMSLQSGGAWASVPVSIVHLAGSEPAQLGRKIAQAVCSGIGQEKSSTFRNNEGGAYASQK